MSVGKAFDNLVGIFSPKSQLHRMAARELVDQVSKRSAQYAAAKSGLNTGEWTPVDSKINTILANSLAGMRGRARQLVRDMPAMAVAVKRVKDFTVGTGLTLQARVNDPSSGKLHKKINQQIEDAWKYWCDEADESGRLHFTEMQQLSVGQEIEVGEYVFIKKRSNSSKRYLPFSLLMLEPDQLSTYGGVAIPGNEIHQGVEYNKATGQVAAYHFEDYDRWKETMRVPADQVICGFETLRPGQLRGVTTLAPVILLAHSLRDYLEAEISTAQKAARWLAFVTSPDPASTMAAFGAAQSPSYTDTSGNSKYVMEVGHSIIDFLKTGEQVTIADHNRPGSSFEPFVKFILKTFAATVGVSYELISGDYYDAKYTAARISRNDMLKGIGIRRQRLVRQFCENVRKEFMDWAVLTGKINLPNYFTNPAPYLRAVWVDPGMESLDPLREGRAEADAVSNKLRSPQEILLARGRDPEQVLDEIQEWDEMLKERGIKTAEEEKQALKTNPAAVAPGTGSLEGEKNGKKS